LLLLRIDLFEYICALSLGVLRSRDLTRVFRALEFQKEEAVSARTIEFVVEVLKFIAIDQSLVSVEPMLRA